MKTKLIFIMGAIFICTFIGAQELKAQEKTTKYYVVTNWVNYNNGEKSRPLVTNVVKVVCEYQTRTSVSNQFFDFFNAEHKRRSGGSNLQNAGSVAFTFDTYEKAEKKRRELIADYNNDDWDTYLVKDFTFMCED